MTSKWRRADIDATSSRRIGVNRMSFQRCVPAGFAVIHVPPLPCRYRKHYWARNFILEEIKKSIYQALLPL